jgi:hypothetical protein
MTISRSSSLPAAWGAPNNRSRFYGFRLPETSFLVSFSFHISRQKRFPFLVIPSSTNASSTLLVRRVTGVELFGRLKKFRWFIRT